MSPSQRTLHHYQYPIQTISSRNSDNFLSTTPFRLLDLPFSIRRRIYILAGLFSGFDICLNYDTPIHGEELQDEAQEPFCTQNISEPDLQLVPQLMEIDPWSEQLSHFIEGPLPYPKIMLDREIWGPLRDAGHGAQRHSIYDHPPEFILPFQLLYVSHQVSMDTKKIFWSENFFSVSYAAIGGLSFMMSLPRFALRSMTSLAIRLNHLTDGEIDSYGIHRPFRIEKCHPGCPQYGYEDIIGNHVNVPAIRQPNKEKIFLKTFQKVCERLSKFITPGNLDLWIVCDVANKLGAELVLRPLLQLPLLRNCAIRLSNRPEQELQNIARHTATLLKSFEPRNNLRSSFLDLPYEIQTQILEYTDVISVKVLEWSLDNDLRPILSPKTKKCDNDGGLACCNKCSDDESVCYCSHSHSAYSSKCTCWRFPNNLFLVSRDFRNLVVSMFFSRNKFRIIGSLWTAKTTGLYTFLTGIPVAARPFLTHIHWTPQRRLQDPDYAEWLKVVDFCSDQFDISKVTFTIDMSYSDRRAHEYNTHEYTTHQDLRGEYSRTLREVEWDLTHKMARAMKRYRGWKDVFFHLNFQPDLKFPNNRKRLEVVLECIVQGRNYDSYSRGKVYRECECEVYVPDSVAQEHADYWEEIYQDDPDFVFITSPTVKSGDGFNSYTFAD